MKKQYSFFVFMSAIVVVSSCARICTVQPVKVNVDNNDVVFGTSKIPCKKVQEYEKAVNLAIKAIYSSEFEKRLVAHIRDSIGTGAHTNAWINVNAKDVVQQMKNKVKGEFIETYGGVKGLWLYIFYHNIAYDGTANGPIRLNRIPLRKRTASSIANTIAHETAHRIGLTHPHSNIDLSIAYKEPPYIIGDMIEEIIGSGLGNLPN